MFNIAMRSAFVSFMALLLASSYASADAPLKVVTFNIKYDGHGNKESNEANAWLHKSGKHRRDRVLEVIADTDPDLLGVQEALHHQVVDIAEHLTNHDYYAVGRDDGKAGGEHCAIYFRRERFKQIDAGTFWLSEQPAQPGSFYPGAACTRIASWVLLEEQSDPPRQLVFLNTHFDHVSQPAREFSASAIVQRLTQFGEKVPFVVVGDMNAVETSQTMRLLIDSDQVPLLDAYRTLHPEPEEQEATINRFKNITTGRRIDYVLHSPALTVRDASIVRTTFDGKNASDHFPVSAELSWGE